MVKHGEKINQYILPIMALDIIIGPASFFYSLPITTFIFIFYSIIWFKNFTFIKNIVVYIFIASIITSTLLSLLFKEGTIYTAYNFLSYSYINTHVEDVKRCLYLLLGIVIYMVMRISIEKYEANVKRRINIILAFTCLLFLGGSVLFYTNLDLFYNVKNVFFSVDVNVLDSVDLIRSDYIQRYGFILLDPNNAGYFILMISIYLIENGSLKYYFKPIIWVTALVAPFLTMSFGTLCSLTIYLIIKILRQLMNLINVKINKNFLIIYSICSVVLITIIILVIVYDEQILSFAYNIQAIERWLDKSTDSSRLDKYIYMFKDSFPQPIGMGYTIIREGADFRPHSDHLRFLYSFGFISYISIWVLLIRRRLFDNKCLFLIPALMAFSINSLIDETRLFYTFLILLAIIDAKSMRQKNFILLKGNT